MKELLKALNNSMKDSYYKLWEEQFEDKDMHNLINYLKQRSDAGNRIIPSADVRWKAFDHHEVSDLKVVILGQDPYHTIRRYPIKPMEHTSEPTYTQEYVVANGLAFDYNKRVGQPVPPSLKNILKEMKDEGFKGNWGEELADQGVLLLNTALTVEEKSAGKHSAHWHKVMRKFILNLSSSTENVAWILWGKHAQSFKKEINLIQGHLVLESAHPSPLSASKGFFNNHHFQKANNFLESKGRSKIDW